MKSPNVQVIADDFGYSESSDKVMLELLKKQTIQGVAILATHTLDRCKNLPKNTVCGLHINLIEGKPISLPHTIPSLVNKEGSFYSFPLFFLRLITGKIRENDLKKEINAQFQKLRGIGIHLTEINSHQHIHALAPIAQIISYRDWETS